jgi:hypothetical protein
MTEVIEERTGGVTSACRGADKGNPKLVIAGFIPATHGSAGALVDPWVGGHKPGNDKVGELRRDVIGLLPSVDGASPAMTKTDD